MPLQCAFKALLLSVFLWFCQQGLANDTYDLEEFREHYKKNDKPPLKKPQKRARSSTTSPFENIRIGFFGLNLTDDDVSGDERLETYNDFVVHEQGFLNLLNFYSYYVNIGGPQDRHGRIQNALNLILRIFTVNMTTETSPENKQKIHAMAKRLFEQLFLSATINGESNPYYHYFNSGLSENPSDSTHINHGLVMMFFAFLGPHLFTGYDDYFDHASVLIRRFTHQHYHQALSDSRLSDNIGEYNTPEHFANQLIAAGLDAETALLITLCALAHASYFCMNINDVSWQETLEELLKRFVPSHFILVAYNNMNILCTGSSGTVPDSIFYSMNEFTENLMGIEIQNSLSRKKPKAANLTDASTQYSDSDWRSKFEDHNEEIEQEAGAVGGATEESHECKVCSGSPPYKAIIENVRSLDICENCCRKMGICETCIERAFKE